MALSHTPHTVSVIDNSGPSEVEARENEKLLQYMRDQNLYETPDEFQHRVDVLQLLLELVPQWVQTVAEHLGKSEAEIEAAHGFVFSYGSFRLSTHGPGDDIDTLCVGPVWCTRGDHFFGQEHYCLEAMLRRSNWVSKVQAVPEAFVPVLKLEIRGIDIDLPYAQLPMNELPMEIDLQDNNLLRDMDATSVTSINGCRVTDKLVQLNTVNGKYREAFQDALRFLKMWAKRRGIYSNVMGFLGGVNFAILTTRTCLHYPNACASTIVRNFFRLFAAWDWAGAVPVMVTGIDRGGPASDMVWDPTISMHQGREIFPIITPCYPASNSTFNVSDCTKGILINEFQRGRDIVVNCPLKEDPGGGAVKLLDFAELAEPVNFLGAGSFANYLQVIAAASSNEDFAKWSGFINAKVKHFVSRLHNAQGMLRARPWPKEFPVPMEECTDGRQRTSWLIGLTKQAPANAAGNRRIDIRSTIQDFKSKCETWTGHGADMTLEIKHLVFHSLPEYLAVQGRVAAQRTVDQEAAPSAAAPGAEQRPSTSTDNRNWTRADATNDTAELMSDANLEREQTGNQNQATCRTANTGDAPDSRDVEAKVDVDMLGDSQGHTKESECSAGDDGDAKASAVVGETASPLGAKRKRNEVDGNHRDGLQRISSHAS